MSNINIETPGVIKFTNTSNNSKSFTPYKENFVVFLPTNYVLEIGVKTAGQVLYYLGQATEGLNVEFETEFSAQNVNDTIHYNDEKITIVNSSDKTIKIMPYRENFTYDIEAGDTLELTANTVGQVLYYLSQATDGLTITHEYVGE